MAQEDLKMFVKMLVWKRCQTNYNSLCYQVVVC